MDPAIEHGLLRRRSGRLRKRQRLNDDDDDDGEKEANCYRPKATASSILQDCGILPSE